MTLSQSFTCHPWFNWRRSFVEVTFDHYMFAYLEFDRCNLFCRPFRSINDDFHNFNNGQSCKNEGNFTCVLSSMGKASAII